VFLVERFGYGNVNIRLLNGDLTGPSFTTGSDGVSMTLISRSSNVAGRLARMTDYHHSFATLFSR
jgi:hypothetical protein